jgi:hypothetical protein
MVAIRSHQPIIHLYALTFSQILGIDPFAMNFIIPNLAVAYLFVFSYLFLQQTERELSLSNKVLVFALLALPISTLIGAASLSLERQTFAWLFLITIIYLLFKSYIIHNTSIYILISIFLIVLSATHDYTPAIMAFFLIVLATILIITTYIKPLIKKRKDKIDPYLLYLFGFAVMEMIFLGIWWALLAPNEWLHIRGLTRRIIAAFIYGELKPTIIEFAYHLPKTPYWNLIILGFRDASLIISAVIGFILLVRKKDNDKVKNIFVFSLVTVLIIFISDALIFWLAPYRIISLFIPFIVLCIGICYGKFSQIRLKLLSGSLMLMVIIVLIFSSLIGFTMHRFTPSHFYDPTVTWWEMGEHPSNWAQLKGFFTKNTPYANADNILTDDIYVLSLLLPLDQINKMHPIISREANTFEEGSMVIAFRGLGATSYIPQGMPLSYNPEFDEAAFKQKVVTNLNLIYTSGGFAIWR